MRRELDLDPDNAPARSAGGQILRAPKAPKVRRYFGIDGEGIGRRPHRYVLLAVSSETGDKRWWVENLKGLSSLECLHFLVNLPMAKGGAEKSVGGLFAYSFGYDLTKILQDLPNEVLYRLYRPDKRPARFDFQGPTPVEWEGFTLNYLGQKFSVEYKGRSLELWDIWKFYQGKFTTALEDWKIAKEDKAEIEHMKSLRDKFTDADYPEIRDYCFTECKYMAELAHKLVDAHEEAGLKLTSFYGAGSTATAMLKLMGIKEALRAPPAQMRHAVASAFFGGRFENSVLGPIPRPVKNFDISSAYPYQTVFLPCLLHGEWHQTAQRRDLEHCRAAVVEYELGPSSAGPIKDWAPFPFRGEDGSICFPTESGGGWLWRDEYLAGERFCERYPGAVRFKSAWVYECSCTCQPFAMIPHYYRERCRIGKEGAGIVFKLGPNSVYGKLAQSIGSAAFQSWVWAGIITSGCRAQLLDLIGAHPNRRDVLMVATDGLFSAGRVEAFRPAGSHPKAAVSWKGVEIPTPKDTETWATGKPLGGWEIGDVPQGIFAARPGIYFPLNPTENDLKKVKGRGVGKSTILKNHAAIVKAYEEGGVRAPVIVKDIPRFCGGKTSISLSPASGVCSRAEGGKGATGQDMPSYGEWIARRVEMSFDPMPKRAGVAPDGVHLLLRKMPLDLRSMPYKKAIRSVDALLLEAAGDEEAEQPDGDPMALEVDFANV